MNVNTTGPILVDDNSKNNDILIYTKEDVKRIRKSLNYTQPKFAKLLGVSVDAVKTWESGRYVASPATRRLLFLIEQDKSIVNKLIALENRNQTTLPDE